MQSETNDSFPPHLQTLIKMNTYENFTLFFLVFFLQTEREQTKDISSQTSALVYNELDELPLCCYKIYLCSVHDHSANY